MSIPAGNSKISSWQRFYSFYDELAGKLGIKFQVYIWKFTVFYIYKHISCILGHFQSMFEKSFIECPRNICIFILIHITDIKKSSMSASDIPPRIGRTKTIQLGNLVQQIPLERYLLISRRNFSSQKTWKAEVYYQYYSSTSYSIVTILSVCCQEKSLDISILKLSELFNCSEEYGN